MKYYRSWFTLCCCFILLRGVSVGQVTIVNTDVSGAYVNSVYVHDHDTLSGTYNMGNSSDGQTWNFSFISYHAATTERDTEYYYSPSGQIGASYFPTANLCQKMLQTDTGDGLTMTMNIGQYINVTSNGVYGLGTAVHLHITPAPPEGFPYPEDTLVISYDHPNGLFLPLPLSGNSSPITSVDTIAQFGRGTTITTNTFTPAGSGTVTLPGGRTQQAVRLLEHQVIVSTPMYGSPSTDDEMYVYYWCKDGTQLYFHVPDGYTTGSTSPISYETMTKTGTLGVKETSDIVPSKFRLDQNYPNPFNPTTNISFDVQTEQFVTVKVYSMLGEEVATLVNERLAPGSYQTRFDGNNLSSGVYLYRITAGNLTQTKSMLLVK
jgi:hypothetical protein